MELSAREQSHCVLLSVIVSLITPYTGSTTVSLFWRFAVHSPMCALELPHVWFSTLNPSSKPGIRCLAWLTRRFYRGGEGEGALVLQKGGIWSKVAANCNLSPLAGCALAGHFPFDKSKYLQIKLENRIIYKKRGEFTNHIQSNMVYLLMCVNFVYCSSLSL